MLWAVLLFFFVSMPQSVSAGTQPSFKLHIFPLECSLDLVENGSSNSTQITPDNCEDILFPKPPAAEPSSQALTEPVEPVLLPPSVQSSEQQGPVPEQLQLPPALERAPPAGRNLSRPPEYIGAITGAVQAVVLVPVVIAVSFLLGWSIWRALRLVLLIIRRSNR